jgi:protoporphyrinogen oxidase
MKIGIVGGGLMGLALAKRLSEQGHQITVFEGESQLGGLTTHHDYGGFIWDRFYHVILPTDQYLLNFIKEIGLHDKLGWNVTQTGFFVDEQFHPLNTSLDFLRFPPLSLWSKMRLAFTILYCSRINNWRKLEQVTVDKWLSRISGRKTFDKLWKPLLLAKLGVHYKKVSAVFIWTYIKRMFSARDSAAQKEQLGYVSGSYKTVFDRLEQLITQNGGSLLLQTRVKSIRANSDNSICIEHDENRTNFDKVIFTAPTNVLATTVDENLASVDDKGSQVEYLGVVCAVVVTKTPLMPYYVLNIADQRIPFTGAIGVSNVTTADETGGYHLTYLPKYVISDDPLFAATDDEIKQDFMAGLKTLFPDFEQSEIVSIHVNRARKVQPLQVLDYSSIVPRSQSQNKDFYILNTAQFVSGTLNNNEVIRAVDDFMEKYKTDFKE